MPPAWGSEDRQPNEVRLNRKGASTVPLVRSTTPRWTGRSEASQSESFHHFHGRGRGSRGFGRNYGTLVASHVSPQLNSRVRFNTPGRPWPGFSTHTSPGDLPHAPNSFIANAMPQGFLNSHKRMSSSSDVRQAKRPRLDNLSNEHSHSGLAPASPLPASIHTKMKNKAKSSCVEIKLDLPLHCRRGVHGYHKSRRHWLDREIQRVEQERKVVVHHTEFLDREVLLRCHLQSPSIRDEFSTVNQDQEHEVDVDITEESVDHRMFGKIALEGNIQTSMAAMDKNSARRTAIEYTSMTPRDHESMGAKKATSTQNTIAQSSTSMARSTIPARSTQITLARFSDVQVEDATSRPSPPRPGMPLVSASSSGESHTAEIIKIPPSAPCHGQLLQTVPSPTQHVSSSVSTETMTRNVETHLPRHAPNGFRSGTLVIKSASSATLLSSQKSSTSHVIGAIASDRSSTPSFPRPGSQSVQTSADDDSDSDSDTPLISITSRAKHRRTVADTSHHTASTSQIPAIPAIPAIPTIAHSLHNYESSSTSLTLPSQPFDIESVRIPQNHHDRTRRILVSSSPSLVNVTSHGFVNLCNLSPLRHRYVARTPVTPACEQVDDACLLRSLDSTVVVLGHARVKHQISLLALNRDRELKSTSLDRPWNQAKKGGVSVVSAMMQPQKFVSGGYDHIVHIWTVKEDFSSASPSQLAIKHVSAVQSLLPIRDTSHKLVSAGADSNVHIWDFSSERVVNSMKTSNSVFHAHATSSPYCILLEVAHRELQFELRDHRLISQLAVQRFGYPSSRFHGRFIKGDLRSNEFACGGRDGCVRLWDMRNLKDPSTTISCFSPAQKVVQVVFDQSDGQLLVSSANNDIARVRYVTEDIES